MEPKNHLIDFSVNHLPNLHFFGSMLIFRGVDPGKNPWRCFKWTSSRSSIGQRKRMPGSNSVPGGEQTSPLTGNLGIFQNPAHTDPVDATKIFWQSLDFKSFFVDQLYGHIFFYLREKNIHPYFWVPFPKKSTQISIGTETQQHELGNDLEEEFPFLASA